MTTGHRLLACVLASLTLMALASCRSSNTRADPTPTDATAPATDSTPGATAAQLKAAQRDGTNPIMGQPTSRELNEQEQRDLVDRLWQAQASSPPDQRRESLKQIAWQASTGATARIRAIELLTGDLTDAQNADTRAMLALLVAVEPDTRVVQHVSQLAAQRGWTELVPALMRSLARRQPVTEGDQRPEAIAITALTRKPLAEAAFELFAAEPKGRGRELDRAVRARQAAWDVLARIDPDGSQRARLAQEAAQGQSGAAAQGTEGSSALQRSFAQLGAIPLTGEQLTWVQRMREQGPATRVGGPNETWWDQALAAVAARGEALRPRWALHHIEPARAAQTTNPALLSSTRAQLVALVTQRLAKRERFERAPEGSAEFGTTSERFSDNQDKLATADLLAIIVVDDALATLGLATELWNQAQRDMDDRSTEHGGLIIADWSAPQSPSFQSPSFQSPSFQSPSAESPIPWLTKPFRPAAAQRASDNTFAASQQMIDASTLALAHYHFHAQRTRNARYAGPSPGDAQYAARHGCLCLIFTPVAQGRLNADLLFPSGVAIDLGVLTAAP
jgi:hypothetical protein